MIAWIFRPQRDSLVALKRKKAKRFHQEAKSLLCLRAKKPSPTQKSRTVAVSALFQKDVFAKKTSLRRADQNWRPLQLPGPPRPQRLKSYPWIPKVGLWWEMMESAATLGMLQQSSQLAFRPRHPAQVSFSKSCRSHKVGLEGRIRINTSKNKYKPPES